MAQKERLLKRLLNAIEEGDRIHIKDLTLAGKKIEYLTRWHDGRLVAVYTNPRYNPNVPQQGKKKEPERYAFYIDELPTVKVAELLRDIIPQVERLKNEAQEQPTQNQ